MRAFCWAGSGITAENETERSAFLPNLDVSCLGCKILLDRLVGTLIFKVSCASSLIDSAQLSSVCPCFFAVLFTKDKTISCALALDAPAACWCTGTHVPLLMPDEQDDEEDELEEEEEEIMDEDLGRLAPWHRCCCRSWCWRGT